MKSVTLLLCLAFCLFQSGELWAQALIRKGYLQMATQNSINIRWRTNIPTDGKVMYGTSLSNLDQTAVSATPATDVEVVLSGLQPNTKYYYSYGSSDKVFGAASADQYFYTLPATGTPKKMRFFACGDLGSYNQRQTAVRDQMLAFEKDVPVDGWLVLGDITYKKDNFTDGSDTLMTWGFFNYYADLMKRSVCWPAPGNHDYLSVNMFESTGPYFDCYTVPANGESGGVASGTEAYYSFDIGNAHFLSLNSENWQWATSSSSPQADWMRQDLPATNQTWKIAYWHAPPYTKGSHDSDSPLFLGMMAPMRENYVPILEENNIDLVLGGHSHNYERSFMINGHYGASSSFNPSTHLINGESGNLDAGKPYIKDPVTGKGAVYVVSGCGGKLDTDDGSMNHPIMHTGQDTVSGFSVIDIHADTLRCRFVSMNGKVIDDFTIIKPGATTSRVNVKSALGQFLLSPNPARQNLTLKCDLLRPAKLSVAVFDLNGKKVSFDKQHDTPAGESLLHLDEMISNLPSGFYTLQIRDGSYPIALKFCKVD